MGWMQGLRFPNIQLLKLHLSDTGTSDHLEDHAKIEIAHVEQVATDGGRTESSGTGTIGLIERHPGAKSHSMNAIETLLENTFGRGNSRCLPSGNQNFGRQSGVSRHFQDEELPDSELPCITKDEVMSKKLPIGIGGVIDEKNHEDLWIVVNGIVYDCSKFIEDHPGGRQVILNFVGEDCSWQFWRFHCQNDMQQYGRALRIGRTIGVPNRFSERLKYVGLAKLGHDEW